MSDVVSARRLLGELVVRVYDLGPEPAWHEDRSLFGPWRRFEAELMAEVAVRVRGSSPEDAVHRLVTMRRAVVADLRPEESGPC